MKIKLNKSYLLTILLFTILLSCQETKQEDSKITENKNFKTSSRVNTSIDKKNSKFGTFEFDFSYYSTEWLFYLTIEENNNEIKWNYKSIIYHGASEEKENEEFENEGRGEVVLINQNQKSEFYDLKLTDFTNPDLLDTYDLIYDKKEQVWIINAKSFLDGFKSNTIIKGKKISE